MTDCIFCKIIAKELPSYTLYEDVGVLAFLDIHPVHPGHALVVSKHHAADLLVVDQQLNERLIGIVANVARAVKAASGADGLNISTNIGVAAGQVIYHVHWHIVPRYADDGLRLFPQKEYASADEAQSMQKNIRDALNNNETLP